MSRNDEDTYPDTVQGIIAQVAQVGRDVPLPPTLSARVQATIATLLPAAPFAHAPPPPPAALAMQLALLLDVEETQAQRLLHTMAAAPGPPWRPCQFSGVRLLPVAGGPRVARATCILAYGQPGMGFPPHRHVGDEWTLVLQGWIEEDSGHRWGPGDLLHRTVGSVHALHAVGTTPCVCAIVDAGDFEIVAPAKR